MPQFGLMEHASIKYSIFYKQKLQNLKFTLQLTTVLKYGTSFALTSSKEN